MSTNTSHPPVCFYFQVHQPYRLRDLRATDIGRDTEYFDEEKNGAIFRKVAEKCYLPANAVMLDLLEKNPEFKIAYSLSGTFLDQCMEFGDDVLESFRKLAATGRVEFLAETYYHSLSSLKSVGEFCEQVSMHVQKINELFGKTPTTFRNTELVYSNRIAQIARLMGFSGILAEGADHLLQGKSPTKVYEPPRFRLAKHEEAMIRSSRPLDKPAKDIRVLLKHYRLSDDIAFRFSNKHWAGYPLTAETFADWVSNCDGHSVNLFMDYETFGEHQWADTGIFDFLRALPGELQKRGIGTETPAEAVSRHGHKAAEPLDAHAPVSWADTERDLSAWLGNTMQQAACDALYALERAVKDSGDKGLINEWRRLQTSDHLYYMCTKYWSDGDVHKYFSPYDSPYEAYRRFSHALCDLRERTDTSPSTL